MERELHAEIIGYNASCEEKLCHLLIWYPSILQANDFGFCLILSNFHFCLYVLQYSHSRVCLDADSK